MTATTLIFIPLLFGALCFVFFLLHIACNLFATGYGNEKAMKASDVFIVLKNVMWQWTIYSLSAVALLMFVL